MKTEASLDFVNDFHDILILKEKLFCFHLGKLTPMKFVSGIIVCLGFGFFLLAKANADDCSPEDKKNINEVRFVKYSPAVEDMNDSYSDWKNKYHKKVKKIRIRQRSISPYRGVILTNLTATSMNEGATNIESEPTVDNDNENSDSMIEVTYAKELLNQTAEITIPTLTDYEN